MKRNRMDALAFMLVLLALVCLLIVGEGIIAIIGYLKEAFR